MTQIIPTINKRIEKEIIQVICNPCIYTCKQERIEQFKEIIKYCQERILQELEYSQ